MDKRTLTALAVSFAILMLYYKFVMPLFVKQPAPAAKDALEAATPAPSPAAPAEIGPAGPGLAPATPSAAIGPLAPAPAVEVFPEPELFTLETSELVLTFSTAGGTLEEAVLKDYMDTPREHQLVLLRPATEPVTGATLRSLTLTVADPERALRLWERPFQVTSQSESSIEFQAELPTGITVVKRYELPAGREKGPGGYHLDLTVELRNRTAQQVSQDYDIFGGVGLLPEGGGRLSGQIQGTVKWRTAEGKSGVKHMRPKKPGGIESIAGDFSIVWGATKSQYFACALEPLEAEGQPFVAQAIMRNMAGSYAASLRTKAFALNPGETVSHKYRMFIGPIAAPVLQAYPECKELLDYGWFGSISVILLAVLGFFYRLTANYGVSIILLTFVIRLVLFPLSRKQAMSSYKMQKLQPLVNELRAKYKGNQQKMSQEMMKLYKEQGANPLTGCLPMLLQLPILWGFFRGLTYAIELRQAPFVGWISDLSQPDALFKLPFTLLGISTFNVLPLIMVGATIWQQKLITQPSADPQQKQMQMMMRLMPVFMGYIFYSMPSGLVLYWTTSTALSVAEQVIIRKHLKALEEKGEAPAAVQVKDEGPKKRKFKPRGTK